MIETYFPVVFAFTVAILLAFGLGLAGSLLGPKHPSASKSEPFECGVPNTGTIGERYSVRFFLTAVLFLLFDVEAVFLFPWATVFREFVKNGFGFFLFFEMTFFLGILLLGWFYVWKKGALKWE